VGARTLRNSSFVDIAGVPCIHHHEFNVQNAVQQCPVRNSVKTAAPNSSKRGKPRKKKELANFPVRPFPLVSLI